MSQSECYSAFIFPPPNNSIAFESSLSQVLRTGTIQLESLAKCNTSGCVVLPFMGDVNKCLLPQTGHGQQTKLMTVPKSSLVDLNFLGSLLKHRWVKAAASLSSGPRVGDDSRSCALSSLDNSEATGSPSSGCQCLYNLGERLFWVSGTSQEVCLLLPELFFPCCHVTLVFPFDLG